VLARGNIIPRADQVEALIEVKRLIRAGHRDIVIEAPTGSGKSVLAIAIGMCARSWANNVETNFPAGVCISTPQKMLQDQYEDDFDVNTLKGRSNYPCYAIKDNSGKKATAAECVVPHISGAEAKRRFMSSNCGGCVYKQKVGRVVQAHPSEPHVLNFSTLLYHQAYATTMQKMGVLLIDEAHGVEGALRDFFTLELTNDFADLMKASKFEDAQDVKDYLSAKLSALKHNGLASSLDDGTTYLERRSAQERACKEVTNQLHWLDHDAGWMVTDVVRNKKKEVTKVEVRPRRIGALADVALPRSQYGIRVYLSATLSMAKFCDVMGLDRNKVGHVVIPSTFPVNRRPALRDYAGKMGRAHQEKTLPLLHKKITSLLDKYDKVRVIIHSVSGDLAQAISDGFAPQHVFRRVLHKGGDKRRALAEFTRPVRPTAVLISPSVSEGFNGKDSLCRLNIIPKVSYPYLGDPIVAALAREDPEWYAEQAARTVVQQYGRVMRHKEDYGITYILDRDFDRLYTNHRDLFPLWFQEAIRVGDKKLGIKDRVALV
jgi:Rad3-related DNA helicase